MFSIQKRKTASQRRLTAANIRNAEEFRRLPFSERQRRLKALKALSKMRKQNLTLAAAARAAETNPQSVKQIVGTQGLKKIRGHYEPTKSDRLLRIMVVPTTNGKKEISFRSARTASRVSEYENAVEAFANAGDATALERLGEVTIVADGEHITLLTDLDTLEQLGEAGELSFESIYAGDH